MAYRSKKTFNRPKKKYGFKAKGKWAALQRLKKRGSF